MSLLAGVFSRRTSLDGNFWKEKLPSLLSNNPLDTVEFGGNANVLFAKLDVGAFGIKAFRAGKDGSLAMLAGEPLLADPDALQEGDRARDLDAIQAAFASSDHDVLKRAQGVYSAACFDPKTQVLTLVSDKGGIRPLWYHCSDDLLVFSSKLSLLESIDEVPKRIDMRGVAEIAAFGFPLGDRTQFKDIHCLRPGEFIRISPGRVDKERYWRWDRLDGGKRSGGDPLQVIADRFGRAVSRLNHGDRNTTAMLSGGLDSRCIVTALCDQGVETHTFNFAPEGTLDKELGNAFAAKARTHHVSEPMIPGTDFDLINRLKKSLEKSPLPHFPPERPRVVWAGTGTASTVGLHRMTEPMVELFRKGKKREGVREFLTRFNYRLPANVFKPDILKQMETWVEQGVLEEMEDIQSGDTAHDFRIFLLLNYERHHSDQIFQEIDTHRIELLCPFLDWNFVEAVFAVPVEESFQRRLYNKVIWKLPALATSVAWQTYPGHEPCPLPLPAHLPDQWAKDSPYQAANRLKWLAVGVSILRVKPFPDAILNKNFLFRAVLLQWLGVREYAYAFRAAKAVSRPWKIAKGVRALD